MTFRALGLLVLATASAYGQTATALTAPFDLTFLDSNGRPLSSGTVTSYAAGTTTPLVTYSDRTLSTPNSNPITLNAAGKPPNGIWLGPSQYKFLVKTSGGTTVRTMDYVSDIGLILKGNLAATGSGQGAAMIGYAPAAGAATTVAAFLNASGFIYDTETFSPNTLAAACSAAAGVGKTLAITKAWLNTPTQSLAACSPVILAVGQIQPAASATVTLGTFTCQAVQCFDTATNASAVIAFVTKPLYVDPKWWGADSTGVVASSVAFQSAITAAIPYGTVRCSGTYNLSTTGLTATAGFTLEAAVNGCVLNYAGTGWALTFGVAGTSTYHYRLSGVSFVLSVSTGNGIKQLATHDVTISDVQVQGNTANDASATNICHVIDGGATDSIFTQTYNLYCLHTKIGQRLISTGSSNTTTTVNNVNFKAFGDDVTGSIGVDIEDGNGDGSTWTGGNLEHLDIGAKAGASAIRALFTGVRFEGSTTADVQIATTARGLRFIGNFDMQSVSDTNFPQTGTQYIANTRMAAGAQGITKIPRLNIGGDAISPGSFVGALSLTTDPGAAGSPDTSVIFSNIGAGGLVWPWSDGNCVGGLSAGQFCFDGVGSDAAQRNFMHFDGRIASLGVHMDQYFMPFTKAFAGLTAISAPGEIYCSDCNVATPCTGGGAGAYAFRTAAGLWACPF